MEDPGEEWEIEDYSTSGEEVSQSKISWILSRGLWLGKKVVITGVVISSAPLVLPPLVVVSALGFAVSVPFAVVFTSYTCTEKLMSKLLPIPQSSGILEYGALTTGKAEEDGNDEGEFANMEEEEKDQILDTEEKVEMRIELVEDVNKEQQKGNMMAVMDPSILEDSGKVVQEKLFNDKAVKEKGYEEDDGEYLEGDDKGSLGERNVKIEGQGEDFVEESLIKESEDEKPQPVVKRVVLVVEEDKKNANDVKKVREVVVIASPKQGETESAVSKSDESEVLKAESTGLLEKIRDEGNSGECIEKNKKKNRHRKKALGLGGKKEDESVKDTKEREKNSEIRHENLNKVAAGTDREDGRQADEISPEEENRNIEVTVELKGETMKDTVLDDRENAEVAEMPVGSQNILINGNRSEEKPDFVDEEVNPLIGKKQASHGAGMDNIAVSGRHEDVLVESNAINRESAGNGVPSKAEAAIASNEISPSEKNLWEQINAMRLIVGYKAARLPSFTEELKALYVFTGVEPPSSFEDSANIRDAEDKLRFLMSIVGVK